MPMPNEGLLRLLALGVLRPEDLVALDEVDPEQIGVDPNQAGISAGTLRSQVPGQPDLTMNDIMNMLPATPIPEQFLGNEGPSFYEQQGLPQGAFQLPEGAFQPPAGAFQIPPDSPLAAMTDPMASALQLGLSLAPYIQLPEGAFQIPEGSPFGAVTGPMTGPLEMGMAAARDVRLPEGAFQPPAGAFQLPEGAFQLPEGAFQPPAGAFGLPVGEGPAQAPMYSPEPGMPPEMASFDPGREPAGDPYGWLGPLKFRTDPEKNIFVRHMSPSDARAALDYMNKIKDTALELFTPTGETFRTGEDLVSRALVGDFGLIKSAFGFTDTPETDAALGKAPPELTPEERAGVDETLANAGADDVVRQAATGQGEPGALAEESGLSVGTLIAILLGGLAAGAIGGELGGIGAGRGIGAGLMGAGTALSTYGQLELKKQERLREAEKEAKDERDRQNRAALSVLSGPRGAELAAANPELKARAAEALDLAAFEVPEATEDENILQRMNHLGTLYMRAIDTGQLELAGNIAAEMRSLQEKASLVPDWATMPLDEALGSTMALSGTYPEKERVRQFRILAPRILSELARDPETDDKRRLENLAEQLKVRKSKEVREMIKQFTEKGGRGPLPGGQ